LIIIKKTHAMKIIENNIPIDIYCNLRIRTGLSKKEVNAAEIGLKNSLYSVMIEVGGQIIAMGRVIGDGGCFCQVVDICVLPEHQGKGIGILVMEHIHAFLKKLPKSCYVSLIADGEAYQLYGKFGFKETLPASRGMALKIS